LPDFIRLSGQFIQQGRQHVFGQMPFELLDGSEMFLTD
jgi:hypothetical protein